MKKSITIFQLGILVLSLFISQTTFSQSASWDYNVTGSSCSAIDMTGAISLGAGGDEMGYQTNWPFIFTVYNNTYLTSNVIAMNSNGFIRFDGLVSLSARHGQIPTSDNLYGQFLSYGGDTDGKTVGNVMKKLSGTAPSRVLTIAFTYYTFYLGSTIYHADIQVSFYETSNEIRVRYANCAGTTNPADELGMNAGDGTYGTDIGLFPISDTCYTFSPGSAVVVDDPTNFTATPFSSNQINLSWVKNLANNNVMIAYNTTNSFATPTNGVTYALGTQISPGQGTILYTGTGTSFNHSSLPPSTQYYYKVWSYNGTPIYSAGVDTFATTIPVADPSNFTATTFSSSQIDLSWIKNIANNNVMVAYNTTNLFATPTNGITYIVGNQISTGQGTVIYNGSGTSYNHMSLPSGTHYYKIWSYDGSIYYSNGQTANATTTTIDDPSNLTTTPISHTQINLAWTKNALNQDVMVVRHSNSTFATPYNGNTYFVGALLSANLEKVIYLGSATSFNDTGLTFNTNYCYKIFSYDVNHYYSSGITACDTTMAPGIFTFPYIQDFETTTPIPGNTVPCTGSYPLNIDWTQSATDNIDWVPRTGGTPSNNTGPTTDNTASGTKYLYTEASGCYSNTADLISPLFNFVSLSNPTLEFFYHMYGNNMGTLSIQVSIDGGSTWSSSIWSKTGAQNSSQGSAYNQAQISLLAYAGMSNIKIRFKGTTGTYAYSDMAIDDIRIFQSVPMSYASSTCFQNTEAVLHGGTHQEIMQIQVVTTGDQNAPSATQFTINTTGTTSLGDISNAKLWYTGSSSTFATNSQFGGTVVIPGASFPFTGSQVLLEDTNYFWLTYDIPISANYNGIIDACCTQITIASSNKTPTITCPAGNKQIKGYQIVGTGTSTMSTMPVHYDNNNGSEFIYTSAEMGAAKDISKLAFYKGSGNTTNRNPQNVSIYVKNTTISTLATGSYSLSGYTLVYSGAFPNTATSGWMEISFVSPFTYDGTSNFEVLVSQTVAANWWNQYPTWRYSTVTGGNRCRFANSGSVAPGSLSLASSNRLPNIRLEYQLPTLMEYVNSTNAHPDTNAVAPGSTNVQILKMDVITVNSVNPLKVKGFTLSTSGTTSLSDISNAKIYYTGTNSAFSTAIQFDSTIAVPGASLSFIDSVALTPGHNYFWLTYDVKSTATLDNYIDAECTSIIVNDTARTPNIISPVGNKKIRNYVIVGTGTTTNAANAYPTPYGNQYYGTKNQFLIRATDLIAAGVGTGAINSLAFDVSNVNACPALVNFEIKLKNTSSTGLSTSWETGLSSVYLSSSYQPVLGWNSHAFSTPFIWDGVSNILVETCFNNNNRFNNGNASVRRTNTSYTSTHYYRAYNTSVCSSNNNTGTYNYRPNMKFDCALPTPMSYVSSEAFHSDTAGVLQGGTSQEIIGIKVVTSGNASPLSATSFSTGTTGTTSLSDISNAKLWFTGLDSNFAATGQYGSTVAAPASANNFIDTQVLTNGVNYFWLTYDISSTATLGNYVDATCTSINIGGAKTPTVTAPVGKRMISGALSGPYTIGSGGDFPSFSSAVNALNVFGISGAVTFNVISGTYTEQITLNPIASASATNTIIFQSQSGDSTNVILQFAGNITNNFVVKLDGTDYCTFKNMTLKSTGTTYGTVVLLTDNSDWNTITNNKILSTNSSGANAAGIYSYGAGGADNNHITNNNINVGGNYGIFMRGTSTTNLQDGTEIEGNIINYTSYGIYGYYQNAIEIKSNTLVFNGTNATAYGLYLYYCDNATQITKNNINVATSNTNYGMYIRNCDGTSSQRGLIANNFVSQTTVNNAYGFYCNNSNYFNIYNNSINLMSTAGTNARGLYITGGSNYNFVNNIVTCPGGGRAMYISTTAALGTCDYNDLYTSGTYIGRWGWSNRTSLTSWQSSSNKDAHSISVNPNFTTNYDLHVNNFSMDDEGTPLTLITTDIDGDLRDAVTPDIGADEFTANYDASAEAIISPPTAICVGSHNVTVTIKNNGAITLTSLSVNWLVNNTSQTSYSWTGSLLTDSTVDVTIGSYNFASGTNNILVGTNAPNNQSDQYTVNDTSTLSVTVYGNPTTNASSDSSVCSGNTYTISGASATAYSVLNWISSGTGTFTNGTTLTPTYTPSSTDISNGSVYLFLTATGYAGCGNTTDSMLLTIHLSPTVSFSGLASNYCPNDSPDTLVGSPLGGTFLGLGITGNVFDPSTTGQGTHSISYYYTAANSCSNNVSQQTTVYPSTTVTIYGLGTSYCIDASSVPLTITPTGGTLTGNGIVGNSFFPSIAGTGTHVITYSYTDNNGCTFTDVESVTVNALPSVSFTGLALSYCTNDLQDTLTGTPSGGTFSGTGITANIFNPTTAGAGTFNIVYAYQDLNGCTATDTQVVAVNASPAVSFTGFATPASYCADAGIVPLSGTPLGGTFSGNGITGSNFDPVTAGAGTHSITYSYTDATSGCSNSDIQNVTVNSVPIATAYSNHDSTFYNSPDTLGVTVTNGSGNYSYSWSPVASISGSSTIQTPKTINLLSTTIFTVTVTDNITGCVDTGQVTVKSWGGPLSANATASPDSICAGDTVQLNALASGGSGSYTYLWSSSNLGFSSTISNPIASPSVTTTYTVTVSSGTATPVTSSVTVVVIPIPTVSFTGLATSYCENSPPDSLSGTPVGGIFSGTGTNGIWFDPSVAGVGIHPITYSYTDAFGCGNSDVQSTTVNVVPTVTAFANQDSVQYGTKDTLGVIVTGGSSNYSYLWAPSSSIFGSATIQTPITVDITITTIFTVTVTDNVTGCQNTSQVMVVPKNGPLNVIAIASPDSICNGTSSQLNAFASGGSGTFTYLWSSNPVGFSSTLPNPMVAPIITTTYTVNINDGSNNKDTTVIVTVIPAPAVSFTGLSGNYCSNDLTDTLQGVPAGGVFSGPGMTANVFDPLIAGPGNHTIIYTYIDINGCIGVAFQGTMVNNAPTANAGNDLTIPCGASGQAIGSASVWGMTYSWTPTYGLSDSTVSNPIVLPILKTLYYVTVTDTLTGCTATDDILITVTGGPTAIASQDTTVCIGSAVILSASGGTDYMWSTGDTTTSIVVTPSVTTTYVVTVTDILIGCADSDSVIVTVNNPIVNLGNDTALSYTQSIILDAGAGFVSYLWSTGDTTQTLNVDSVGTGMGSETYSVTVTDYLGCQGSDTIVITFTGIHELNNDYNVNLFPNPTKGKLIVEITGNLNEAFELNIISIHGQTVYSESIPRITENEFTKELDMSVYPKGVYFIRLVNINSTIVKKIIVQ